MAIKKRIKLIWISAIVPFLLLFILFFCISAGWFGYMPSLKELENPKSFLASEVISSDGKLLGTFYFENRSSARYQELSPFLKDALIATEDVRFYDHSGVDITAIGRVIWGLATFSPKGGGSTISQQLAKNLFPRSKDASKIEIVIQKLKEWVIAIKLERRYSKDEIIAMYFNKFDFLNLAVGIKSASRVYFNKKPDSLKIEEAALLVGMCQNPSFYNPLRRPDTTLHRRNVVLSQMLKYDYITKSQFDSLKIIPLNLNYQKVDHKEGIATYLREYLRQKLTDWCKEHTKPDGSTYDIYKDGLKIYTTIDYRMQKYAEEAVSEHMKNLQKEFFKHWKGIKNAPFDRELTPEMVEQIYDQSMKRSDRYFSLKRAGLSADEIKKNFNTPTEMTVFSWNGDIDTTMTPLDSIKYYKHFLRCGIMAMNPQTGYVKAYVGGINYKHFQFDHVMVSRRQVGSTFKPFLYALAMQEGEFTPCTKVPNVPVSFDMGEEEPLWTPKNSDDKHEGEMVTLKWALANSVNYVSAFLMKRYGPDAVIQLARKMGVKGDIPAVVSICLGTPELTLYEMVGANSTYANKGTYVEPILISRIEDKHGNVIEQFTPHKNEAMSEKTAFLMLQLMKGVVQSGTGGRLRYRFGLNNPIAGKTGTTQNNSDGWFMGITPDIAAGVWVGAEDRSIHFRSTDLGQGASMALPIWGIFMKKVYSDKTLNVSQGDFEGIDKFPGIYDCDKFEENIIDDKDPFGSSSF